MAKVNKVHRLTTRQRTFVMVYIRCGNATEAYLQAGYSAKDREAASSNARALLDRPGVSAFLTQQQAKLQKRLDVSTYRVLHELACIGYLDPRQLVREDGTIKDLSEMDEDTAAAVASIEVEEEETVTGEETKVRVRTKKVKFWDKVSALEKLGRHLDLFSEKNVAEALRPMSVNVQINVERQLENLSAEALENLIEHLSQPLPAIAGSAEGSTPVLSETDSEPQDVSTLRP